MALEALGDLRDLCSARANLGNACSEVGRYAIAELTLREAKRSAEKLGLPGTAALAAHNLGLVLARRGKLAEARAIESAAVEAYATLGNRRMEGGSRMYLARIAALEGDTQAAEDQARRAVAALATAPPVRAYALATLADVLLATGRVDEAVLVAEEANQLLEELGRIDSGESLVRVVLAEARHRAGEHVRARELIAIAQERLLARAARIRDTELRRTFLDSVPENARTMDLGRAWSAGT